MTASCSSSNPLRPPDPAIHLRLRCPPTDSMSPSRPPDPTEPENRLGRHVGVTVTDTERSGEFRRRFAESVYRRVKVTWVTPVGDETASMS